MYVRTPSHRELAFAPQPCADEVLARDFGLQLEGGRNTLRGFDQNFVGDAGRAFRDRITRIAAMVGVDPGVLAVNALAEIGRSTWMRRGPVENPEVGLDYWHTLRHRVLRAVPAVRGRIRSAIVRDATGNPVHFTNERGVDTGPRYAFRTGQDALLAMASTLAYLQRRLRTSVRAGVYQALHPAVKFAAIRASYNAGFSRGREMIQRAAEGRDPLIRSGDAGPRRPIRTATLRAGQAIHLSQQVFGNVIPCEVRTGH
jgi:hypothetical protein